jgi:hypothetical protein
VIGRNSILFLILWGLSLALSQLLGLFGSPLLASLGLIPVFFTTGLQAGLFGHLFLRRLIMGRKGKARKGLQILFSVAAGIAILMITGLTLILEIPEALAADSRISSASAVGPVEDTSPFAVSQSTSTAPVSSLVPGQLPTSGKLVFNCDEEIERQKQYSLNGYNFGENYTFEEAFTSYEISLDLELDFTNRAFSLHQHQIEGWSSVKWPDYDEDTISIIEDINNASGILNEEGWISGSWSISSENIKDPDDEQYQSSSGFYGYIDDQMEEVVICRLKSNASDKEGAPNEFSAEYDALRTAGKDQLISNWYHPNACYICKIEGIKP